MSPLMLALIALIALALVAVPWMLTRVAAPPPPDDRLALRLAADLGAGAPTLVVTGARSEWRIELDDGTEVLVGRGGVLVRRELARAIEPFTILAAPLRGRSQEDYAFVRCLVPTEGGWRGSEGPGRADATPRPSEEPFLFEGLEEAMQAAGVGYVAFHGGSITTGRHDDVQADDVRAMAELLVSLAVRNRPAD